MSGASRSVVRNGWLRRHKACRGQASLGAAGQANPWSCRDGLARVRSCTAGISVSAFCGCGMSSSGDAMRGSVRLAQARHASPRLAAASSGRVCHRLVGMGLARLDKQGRRRGAVCFAGARNGFGMAQVRQGPACSGSLRHVSARHPMVRLGRSRHGTASRWRWQGPAKAVLGSGAASHRLAEAGRG